MFLARRVIAEYFQITNREAAASGGRYAYKTEFLNGWRDFSRNPCYKTAVAWLNQAPDYAPAFFKEYFLECCPGGRFHRIGFATALSFELGGYSLQMPRTALGDLKELTEEEYRQFPRLVGGQAIYHAPPIEFLSHRWEALIGFLGGQFYKFAASLEIPNDKQAVSDVIQDALFYCEVQLGTPTEETLVMFTWDKEDGNVILQTGLVMDTAFINIYATSRAALLRGIEPSYGTQRK